MIFQQFNLLMQRTAIGNICFPLEIAGVPKAEAVAKAEELLRVVDLEDRAHSYPSQLSGGQKQRVAIARALASDPEVILCDEATSALDSVTEAAIQRSLEELSAGRTVIVVAHRLSTIRGADHIAVIEHERVAEYGSHDELMARGGLYAELWNTQKLS